MAAQRSGVRQVFIPRDNLDDLKDVDEEVKAALTSPPVDSVEDVQQALGIPVRANHSLVGLGKIEKTDSSVLRPSCLFFR